MAKKIDWAPRDALRMLVPGPLALITTMFKAHPNVMTASWMLPLSMDPALVGIAIQPGRLTHEFLTKSEAFIINIPTIDLLSAAHLCGMTSGRDADKFITAKLTAEDSAELDAPWVKECVAHIECVVADRMTIGDHDLFVGHVLQVSADSEAFNGVWNVGNDAVQLLHHLGGDRYAGLSRSWVAKLPEES